MSKKFQGSRKKPKKESNTYELKIVLFMQVRIYKELAGKTGGQHAVVLDDHHLQVEPHIKSLLLFYLLNPLLHENIG